LRKGQAFIAHFFSHCFVIAFVHLVPGVTDTKGFTTQVWIESVERCL